MGIRFAMTAAFTQHAVTILLGRNDFFNTFRVTIDEPAELVTLEYLGP